MNIIARERDELKIHIHRLNKELMDSHVTIAELMTRTGALELELDNYAARIESEKFQFQNVEIVHDLPKIAIYWFDRHLKPTLQTFGLTRVEDIFFNSLENQCQRNNKKLNRFISIGSGNCDLEVSIAAQLQEHGFTNFTLDCIELNPTMLQRGRLLAEERALANCMHFFETDFNTWEPTDEYDAIFVNQSLHHAVNLEGLLENIYRSLKRDGLFIASDMIGRNGHMRWPEALDIVHEFWQALPGGYRYNHQLNRREEIYENWDCSKSGFEGIRAQDILPLLISRFHFQMFLGFANVIDVFIDRGFGPNFFADVEWDRAFIDSIHERDIREIYAGRIKPTHMIAVMAKEKHKPLTCFHHLTPEFCVRWPDKKT